MAKPALLTIHTDGASRGNPGAAAFAYVIGRDGEPAIEEADTLGEMTNNQAEYTALVRALEHALELGANHRLHIHSDSELMVKQMKGEYRVKNEDLRDLYQEARDLCARFQGGVTFEHIRRAHNSRADALCNEALDGQRQGRLRSAIPAPPAPVGPHEEVLDCLRQAQAAWQRGEPEPTPEALCEQLVRLLGHRATS